jgi:tetratricopeptide (TPR) repeat protein
MAAVDAYAPCPCGSGEKFKWCCHKAESYVDRAERLDRNGQHEAALGVVVDGLAKHPGVPWLLLRKAVSLLALGRPDEARAAVGEILRDHPDHFGAVLLNFRLLLETGDLAGAVAQFQSAFARAEGDESKTRFASLAAMLGAAMTRLGLDGAAIKHLELAKSLAAADDNLWIDSALPRARANPSASAWVKDPYRLSTPPEGTGEDARRRFDEAIAWAGRGLWAQAASAFELLSADRAASAAADRNLGLCRLWLGENAAAVEALRRALGDARARAKPTADEVDLEALAQAIDGRPGDDPVEEVELSWPIRDRAGLIERLEKDPRCVAGPADELEDDEAEGGARQPESFLLLDRPKLAESKPGLKPSDLPLVVGRAVVGPDSVALSTRDDGRLNATIDAFTAVADRTIPPAHPRTKVVGSVPRADLVLDVVCLPPTDLEPAERERLTTALLREQIDNQWPETPMVYLGGKSPAAAAKAGGFELPLRAALLLLEESGQSWGEPQTWAALRSRLGVPAEPPIDHSSVKVDELHLGRLALLDPKRLDDDRLVALYERTREWGLPDVVLKAAREITTRPRLLARERFPIYGVYTELAMAEAGDRRGEAALEWVRKGRGVDPQARHAVAAASWDMLELQVRMATEEPEAWVPELVAVMGRYERDQDATRLILTRLVQAGLIRLAPAADEADGMVADSSLLQHLIARYGPRVRTAAGEVGVSATRGGLWTPDAPAAGGGIWTPGSGPAPAPAEKPRIILPGQ